MRATQQRQQRLRRDRVDGAPTRRRSQASPEIVPEIAPKRVTVTSPYLDRVAQRYEEVQERRLHSEMRERERRRRLGLESATQWGAELTSPMEDAAAIDDRSRRDIAVKITTANEVRIYRRAHTELKAVRRSLASVPMNMTVFHEASNHARSHGASPLHVGRKAEHHTGADVSTTQGSDEPIHRTASLVPRGLHPSLRSHSPLPISYVAKPCDMKVAMAIAPQDVAGTIGPDQWRLMITEREYTAPVSATRTHRHRRVHHHRLTCKYNLRSTSREFRQLSLEKTFPTRILRESSALLLHATHGGANGYSAEHFDINECFAPMVVGWWTQPDPAGEATSPPDDDAPFNSPGFTGTEASTGSFAAGLQTAATPLPSHAFMTETDHAAAAAFPSRRPASSMDDRCRTPDVSRMLSLRSLPRPHAERRRGEYWDCSCTDRSTDDELDALPQRYGSEELSKAAAARLDCWDRGFRKATVMCRSRLASLLAERSTDRSVVCEQRRQFAPVTQAAETAGAAWLVNRESRSTTPLGASMWHTFYNVSCEEAEAVLAARQDYVRLCDECALIYFPSTAADEALAEQVRRRYVTHYRDPVVVTPAYVKELFEADPASFLSTAVGVHFLEILRAHAKMPVVDFYELLGAQVTALQRRLIHHPTTPAVAPEAESLLRRLAKSLSAAVSQKRKVSMLPPPSPQPTADITGALQM